MFWQTARFLIDLRQPRVMGIVNATPDSFSDGGQFFRPEDACARCDALLTEGVDILDIGGESTRPGSVSPHWRDEVARVLPVVRHAVTLGVPVSVDTSQPEVMAEVLAAGADIINDVRSLDRPGALAVVAEAGQAGVCLMHRQGEPATMQAAPHYDDVVADVAADLARRLATLVAAGVAADRIALDPGYGFGKTDVHNLTLLRHQAQLLVLGRPLLVGWSRKRTLGNLTGRAVDQRLAASVAAALASVVNGAQVVRVHDVAATVDALKVWRAAGMPGCVGADTIV
ncbi:dihydropteroate synthase [Ideonella sp. B7]|uniref:dihydropteroate synthase n=1 Tax=Ideonella benzenivorans TaxID=2831643 RepID=UPI001CEDA5FE|nr:dihydropteroate synthase [Ideonella benzenivorans]MCA6217834.1 dihydropteroate synthase [Ideonella benzenivorans]